MKVSAEYSVYINGESRPSCIRCAVVGNGGILNGSARGMEIDDHHMIFRWSQKKSSLMDRKSGKLTNRPQDLEGGEGPALVEMAWSICSTVYPHPTLSYCVFIVLLESQEFMNSLVDFRGNFCTKQQEEKSVLKYGNIYFGTLPHTRAWFWGWN